MQLVMFIAGILLFERIKSRHASKPIGSAGWVALPVMFAVTLIPSVALFVWIERRLSLAPPKASIKREGILVATPPCLPATTTAKTPAMHGNEIP